jgi:hypothetical protein
MFGPGVGAARQHAALASHRERKRPDRVGVHEALDRGIEVSRARQCVAGDPPMARVHMIAAHEHRCVARLRAGPARLHDQGFEPVSGAGVEFQLVVASAHAVARPPIADHIVAKGRKNPMGGSDRNARQARPAADQGREILLVGDGIGPPPGPRRGPAVLHPYTGEARVIGAAVRGKAHRDEARGERAVVLETDAARAALRVPGQAMAGVPIADIALVKDRREDRVLGRTRRGNQCGHEALRHQRIEALLILGRVQAVQRAPRAASAPEPDRRIARVLRIARHVERDRSIAQRRKFVDARLVLGSGQAMVSDELCHRAILYRTVCGSGNRENSLWRRALSPTDQRRLPA